MRDLVVDANVAVKWVLDEPHADRAQQLIEATIQARRRLLGPPMLICEVISILFQRRRSRDPQRQISETEAEAALHCFLALPLLVVAPPGLYAQAFFLRGIMASLIPTTACMSCWRSCWVSRCGPMIKPCWAP